MAYTIGQYNKNKENDNDIFLTDIAKITSNLPIVDEEGYTQKVSPMLQDSELSFVDEYLSFSFSNERSYYFHGKIKKRNMPQKFYVKLVSKDSSVEDEVEQFIVELNIPGGYVPYNWADREEGYDTSGWYDVEFTFTPFIDFSGLWFQLIRTKEDYTEATRYPKIIYEELSVINNILKDSSKQSHFDKMDTGIIKMGIQSRPHLAMFINKEDIRTDRSGIYEVKNGNVLVNSFSVINRCDFTDKNLVVNAMKDIDSKLPLGNDETNGDDFFKYDPKKNDLYKLNPMWNPYPEEGQSRIGVLSKCLIGNDTTRQIDSFTMDYMYRDKIT